MEDQTLKHLTIGKIAPQIKSGKLSPVDLTNAVFGRIEALNPSLNAFLTLTRDQALVMPKKRKTRFASEFIVAPCTAYRSQSRTI